MWIAAFSIFFMYMPTMSWYTSSLRKLFLTAAHEDYKSVWFHFAEIPGMQDHANDVL